MSVGKGTYRGRLLDDRYELLEQVGEGAAGTVWLARDRELNITIAVKILRAELAVRDASLVKFAREADLSARMLSPNIVRVLGRGVAPDGTTYIAYELLDGEDLADRLDRTSTLPLAETETVVVHVCRALARAHAVGVVHRDIKPENVFATTDAEGRPLYKVLDFGVADLVASLQRSGAEIAGTFEYMAPEVILEGRVPDVRSDLYSLAVVAYRCLTGRVPYPGETMGEVMLAHARTAPPAVSTMCAEGSAVLDAWFEQALAKDPDLRFAQAKGMAEALHRAVKASRPAPPAPAPRSREEPPPSMRGRLQSFVFDAVELEALQYSSVKMDGEPPPASVRRPSAATHSAVPPPRPSAPSIARPSATPERPAASVPAPAPSSPTLPPDLPPMRPRIVSVIEIDATADEAKSDARRR